MSLVQSQYRIYNEPDFFRLIFFNAAKNTQVNLHSTYGNGLQNFPPLERTRRIIYNSAMSGGKKIIAENRKARFNYFVEDTVECGIVLEGTEVKSVKNGAISFPDAFAEISGGEVFVKNLNIAEYSYSSVFNHNPLRAKKLLLHKEEIKRLTRKTETKGYTLIPLEFYLKNGRVKVALGLCKGKKQFDKKAVIKERDLDREMRRDFKNGFQ